MCVHNYYTLCFELWIQSCNYVNCGIMSCLWILRVHDRGVVRGGSGCFYLQLEVIVKVSGRCQGLGRWGNFRRPWSKQDPHYVTSANHYGRHGNGPVQRTKSIRDWQAKQMTWLYSNRADVMVARRARKCLRKLLEPPPSRRGRECGTITIFWEWNRIGRAKQSKWSGLQLVKRISTDVKDPINGNRIQAREKLFEKTRQ